MTVGFGVEPGTAYTAKENRISAVRRARLLRLLPTVFSGRHVGLPEVEYFQTFRLRIETAPPLAIYADGEYVCDTPAAIEVVPRALRVIVPVRFDDSQLL